MAYLKSFQVRYRVSTATPFMTGSPGSLYTFPVQVGHSVMPRTKLNLRILWVTWAWMSNGSPEPVLEKR
jgi:hypothetical protein